MVVRPEPTFKLLMSLPRASFFQCCLVSTGIRLHRKVDSGAERCLTFLKNLYPEMAFVVLILLLTFLPFEATFFFFQSSLITEVIWVVVHLLCSPFSFL